MNRLERIERSLAAAGEEKRPREMHIGDTVRVYVRVVEGDKERTQMFEGVLIARKGSANRETLTVRKVSYGIGVERTFPLCAPSLEKISVIREGKTRRAKLYYLRGRSGRAAKLAERERPEPAGAAAPAAAAAEETRP